jgi:hypothetical protein
MLGQAWQDIETILQLNLLSPEDAWLSALYHDLFLYGLRLSN